MKSFEKTPDLISHISRDHQYSCKLCTIDLGSYYTWVNHFDTTHPKQCIVCLALFAADTKAARDQHMQQVHGYNTCTICLTCSTESGLKDHYREPNGTHPYRCNTCKINLVNNGDFWMHCFEKHRDFCLLCESTIKNNLSAKIQWDEHLRTTHRMFPCTECFEVFQAESEFNFHYSDKHRISCHICHETFLNRPSYSAHANVAHHIECIICNKYFTTDMIAVHLDIAHRHKCLVCDRVFNSKTERDEHMERVHVNICELCYNVCQSMNELQLHYRNIHGGKTGCKISDYEERSNVVGIRGGKKSSELLENGICSKCNEKFSNEEALVDHYSQRHVNVFRCGVCDADYFDTDEELMNHHKDFHNSS